MLRKIFFEHPETVNETYFEHLIQATRFGVKMMLGGFACIIHALIPCLFMSTARNTAIELNDILVKNRAKQTPLRKGQLAESPMPEGQMSKAH